MPNPTTPSSRVITSQFMETICRRCGGQILKGEDVNYMKGLGVWHIEDCGEPAQLEGRLHTAVELLERLEDEGRLVGFTQGLLDRWRITGRISERQISVILPSEPPLAVEMHNRYREHEPYDGYNEACDNLAEIDEAEEGAILDKPYREFEPPDDSVMGYTMGEDVSPRRARAEAEWNR